MLVSRNNKRIKESMKWNDINEDESIKLDQVNTRITLQYYLTSGSFWLPNHAMDKVFNLRDKYLESSSLAYEGYLYAKNNDHRYIASILLDNHRQFKKHYSAEFE